MYVCMYVYIPFSSLLSSLAGLSVDIWMAEFDQECVASARTKGQLDGVHVLVGDQADRRTLQVRVTDCDNRAG